MMSHIKGSHPEQVDNLKDCNTLAKIFKPEVIRKHSSALTRQLHEAVEIAKAEGVVLNNKDEYNRCLIPSLVNSIPDKPKDTRTRTHQDTSQHVVLGERDTRKRVEDTDGTGTEPVRKRRRVVEIADSEGQVGPGREAPEQDLQGADVQAVQHHPQPGPGQQAVEEHSPEPVEGSEQPQGKGDRGITPKSKKLKKAPLKIKAKTKTLKLIIINDDKQKLITSWLMENNMMNDKTNKIPSTGRHAGETQEPTQGGTGEPEQGEQVPEVVAEPPREDPDPRDTGDVLQGHLEQDPEQDLGPAKPTSLPECDPTPGEPQNQDEGAPGTQPEDERNKPSSTNTGKNEDKVEKNLVVEEKEKEKSEVKRKSKNRNISYVEKEKADIQEKANKEERKSHVESKKEKQKPKSYKKVQEKKEKV